MKYLLCSLLFLVCVATANPEEPAETETTEQDVIVLPSAEITGDRESSDRITAEDIERDNSADLWEAVRYTPGIILNGGGRRGDSTFKVRGFDVDSMPVFIDGVYTANTYRGEGDAARILSGDLESVEIQKGFSSMLLGSNTMGGAILLRTAHPKKPFEAMLKTSFDFDSAGKYSGTTDLVSLGTKQEHYYGKATFQFRGIDHWRLPASFEPDENNPQQPGDRLWSGSTDMKLTLLAGITPIAPLDISLAYTYMDADKGLSPPAVRRHDYSIWDWPIYDSYTIALNAAWTADIFFVKALGYYEKHDNRMDEYMDLPNLAIGNHQAHSDYDEYSGGARLEGGWDINSWNKLDAALTYRKDNHIGLRGGEEQVRVQEDTWSGGLEYTITPWAPFTAKAGLGYDALIPIEFWGQLNEANRAHEGAGYYVVKTHSMHLLSWQLGAFYTISKKQEQEVHLTWAVKNRFPTQFQRYSTQFGSTLPNPDLGPETANHFELGYKAYFFNKLRINAAAYYSIVFDKIQTIKVPGREEGTQSSPVNMAINIDETALWGFELGLGFYLNDMLSAGGAFSWNRYSILYSENAVNYLTYYPAITANAYIEFKPIRAISLIPRLEYLGPRYADTDGDEELDGYVLFNIKASYELNKYFSFSAAIENVLDTYYEISQYNPMPGRSFNVTMTVKY
ncbi:TonB-dependent receptor [Spirochaetia bacterium]|nr:TonB-dependent receptor [Spirochaetia bacterium]